MRSDNLVYRKAFEFALKIIETYKYLTEQQKEYIMSKQLLRSGTSIGANIREGVDGQSKKDFIAKLSISLKEANETEYWLELLIESNYLDREKGLQLVNDVKEIIKILSSIIKTTKENMKSN